MSAFLQALGRGATSHWRLNDSASDDRLFAMDVDGGEGVMHWVACCATNTAAQKLRKGILFCVNIEIPLILLVQNQIYNTRNLVCLYSNSDKDFVTGLFGLLDPTCDADECTPCAIQVVQPSNTGFEGIGGPL